jgi:spermidine/putrescine transport system permease protein
MAQITLAQARSKSTLPRLSVSAAWLVLPATVWLIIFAVLPLAFLVVISFWTSDAFGLQPILTLNNYTTLLADPIYSLVMLETLKIAVLSTILTLLISYPMAYFLASLTGTVKNICLLALFVPFWTSYVVRTFVWLPMLGRNGIVNGILLKFGIIQEPLGWLLYNQGAVMVGLIYVFMLFMILPIYLSLDRLDPRLMEAAADLGAGPFRTFYRVTLPLTMPGVISGSVMVFLSASGAYITPQLLGGSSGVMFGRVIASQFIETFNWALGASLSVVLVLVVTGCLFLFGRRVKFDEIFVGGRH